MIGYCLVGVRDLPLAACFYDECLSIVGERRAFAIPDRVITWGKIWREPHFGIVLPLDGRVSSVGNGSMVAFRAQRREQVDAVHAKALACGGSDEGAPGLRGLDPDGFYGAYFRDPDGNKLCVFRYGPNDAAGAGR